MQKLRIKNRDGKEIAVIVDGENNTRGLAFVMHGLGGWKEDDVATARARAFFENGFTVVRFDTRHTYGESEGAYEDASTTNYYEDLEDVIDWARTEPWYRQPFVLSGHSLGGLCVVQYAENHPQEIQALALVAPVVSGTLHMESKQRRKPEELAEWEHTGWKGEPSLSKPGLIKRIPWSYAIDMRKYDTLARADTLTMPVLFIVGEKDTITPAENTQKLFDLLPGPKEFRMVKDGTHVFRNSAHLAEIKGILSKWIDSWQK